MDDLTLEAMQAHWLKRLGAKVAPSTDLVVCRNVDTPRITLPKAILTHQLPVNHRVITQNEIVFETDMPELEDNLTTTQLIASELRRINAPYLCGYSGNKGFHLHIFLDFKSLTFGKDIAKLFQEKNLTPMEFRNWYVKKKFGKFFSEIKNGIGDVKLDGQMFHKNHPIREFGGLHEKTGFRKTAINTPTVTIPTSKLVEFPEKLEVWRPTDLSDEFVKFVVGYYEGRIKPRQAGLSEFGNHSG